MNIIQSSPNESGVYSQIHQLNGDNIPDGWIKVSETCDLTSFNAAHGFGTPTITDNVMTAFVGNMDAWNAWNAAHPVDTTVPLNIDDVTRIMNSYMTITNARIKKLGG